MADNNIIFGGKALVSLQNLLQKHHLALVSPSVVLLCLFCHFCFLVKQSRNTLRCVPLDYRTFDVRSYSLSELKIIQPPSVPQESDPLHVNHV